MLSRRSLLRAGAGVALVAASGAVFTTAALGAPAARINWAQLRAHLSGSLVLPSDAAYPQAKHLALLQFDSISPGGIAYCETEADVATCLRFAQDNHIPATPRSGGHSLAGWSTTTGLVIDLSRMKSVAVGPQTVQVGPGVQAVDAMAQLAPHNLQLAAGLCGTVCPGGFVTGGGIGWQTRKFGVGCDHLVSARVVLADGRTVSCSADNEPDLFWALRGGGGGNFGIVTEFELTPTQVPRVVTFDLSWPWEHAFEAVDAWQQWTVHGSRNIGSTVSGLQLDAAAGNVPVLLIQGGYLGSPADAEAALNELVSAVGVAPASRVVHDLSYYDAMMANWGCEGTVDQCHLEGYNAVANLPRDLMILVHGRMFDEPLRGAGLRAALDAVTADPHGGQFRNFSLYALGGAANDVGAADTAYVHRNAQFLTGFSAGFATSSDYETDNAAANSWTDKAMAVIDPYSSGHSYVNFPDPDLPNWQHAYYGSNYERLRAVKRAVDPCDFFHRSQSVEV